MAMAKAKKEAEAAGEVAAAGAAAGEEEGQDAGGGGGGGGGDPQIEAEHILAAMKDTRSSVSDSERRRYEGIYSKFHR
jgi:hypothetical protein